MVDEAIVGGLRRTLKVKARGKGPRARRSSEMQPGLRSIPTWVRWRFSSEVTYCTTRAVVQ